MLYHLKLQQSGQENQTRREQRPILSSSIAGISCVPCPISQILAEQTDIWPASSGNQAYPIFCLDLGLGWERSQTDRAIEFRLVPLNFQLSSAGYSAGILEIAGGAPTEECLIFSSSSGSWFDLWMLFGNQHYIISNKIVFKWESMSLKFLKNHVEHTYKYSI